MHRIQVQRFQLWTVSLFLYVPVFYPQRLENGELLGEFNRAPTPNVEMLKRVGAKIESLVEV